MHLGIVLKAIHPPDGLCRAHVQVLPLTTKTWRALYSCAVVFCCLLSHQASANHGMCQNPRQHWSRIEPEFWRLCQLFTPFSHTNRLLAYTHKDHLSQGVISVYFCAKGWLSLMLPSSWEDRLRKILQRCLITAWASCYSWMSFHLSKSSPVEVDQNALQS